MYQTKPLDPVEVTPLEYTLTLSKFQYIQWSIIIELSGNSIELEAFCPMYLKHFASWNQCEWVQWNHSVQKTNVSIGTIATNWIGTTTIASMYGHGAIQLHVVWSTWFLLKCLPASRREAPWHRLPKENSNCVRCRQPKENSNCVRWNKFNS